MRVVTLLDVEYMVGGQELFHGVGLELRHGDKLALTGQNGSGKTTLIRLMMGHLSPSAGRIVRASGTRLAEMPQDPQYTAGETVESVLKDGFIHLEAMEKRLDTLAARLSDLSVHEQWEALHEQFAAAGGYTRRLRYESVLKGLGFAGRAAQVAVSLSGGEARQLALGRTLLSAADALLLDEPTNHLDAEMREWLAGYLRGYQGAILFVSHDRRFMDSVALQVAGLDQGRLHIYAGNYSTFKVKRAAEIEGMRVAFEHWRIEQERLEASYEQARRWSARSEKLAKRKDALRSRVKRHEAEQPPKPPGEDHGLLMRFDCQESVGEVLSAEWLTQQAGGSDLFEVEHLSLRKGERVALIGPNGVGKTTLLKTLLGYLESADPRGRVRIGTRVSVGYYDQRLSGLDPERTLFETLRTWFGDQRAHDLLGAWKFPYQAQFKNIGALSGGERARLALLSLASQQANLLVLDEPTNHLDLETIEALEKALSNYSGTLLVVSHDLAFANALTNRTWWLHDGVLEDLPYPPLAVRARQEDRPRSEVSHGGISKDKPARSKSRWHYQRELEAAEAQIDSLEIRLKEVHAEAQEPRLSGEAYAGIAHRIAALEADLNKCFTRWEELSCILEDTC